VDESPRQGLMRTVVPLPMRWYSTWATPEPGTGARRCASGPLRADWVGGLTSMSNRIRRYRWASWAFVSPVVVGHGALSGRDMGDTLAGCPCCW
jgi:hypothetical protein